MPASLTSLVVSAALTGPAVPEATPDDPPQDAPAQDPVPLVIVDTASADEELLAEFRLRLPQRLVKRSDSLAGVSLERFAWVAVRRMDSGNAELRLILSDGRAYTRRVSAPPAQTSRATAGAVANMLDAIEHNRLPPEEVGVKAPLPKPEQPEQPEHRPAPPKRRPTPPPPQEPEPVWHLGPELAGMAVFGVGPPSDLAGFTGGGGSLRFAAVHRTGALAGASVRAVSFGRRDLQLTRIRVSVSGGYALRLAAFELLTRAGVSVEPLVVRDSGRRADLARPSGGSVAASPLLGAWLRVSPAYVAWSRDRRAAFRLALDAELAGSFELRRSPAAVRLFVPSADGLTPALRAGGIEVGMGLSFGAWFALPP